MTEPYVPAAVLTSPAVHAAFSAAIDNLTRINLVPCDTEVYDRAKLVCGSAPRMIRAGGCYESPWTRDSAVNTWAAGRLLVPEAARNTLAAVCALDDDGAPIIRPDDQVWDRVIWIVGAWQYYLATGDKEFLAISRGIADRALNRDLEPRFDPAVGLYRGGSFFNDGISGYPADLYEPGMDHSFMGMHPKLEEVACLSTNCIYCEAWRILDRMNAQLGIDDPEPARRHTALAEVIRRTFYHAGACAYLRYPDGRLDHSRELSGITFGVLFGILPPEALNQLHREPFGYPSIWPPFPGLFSAARPGRHNNLIWPFLNGFYIQAAARAGMAEAVARELTDLTALFVRSEGFYEIYDARDGTVNGGWQIGADGMQGHLWESCRDQTWSATSYLGAIIHGVFGVCIEEDALSFAPCVPEDLAGSRIEGLMIRGHRFDICTTGHGSRIVNAAVNGKSVSLPRISFPDADTHCVVHLTLEPTP